MKNDADLIPGEALLLQVNRHAVALVGRCWKVALGALALVVAGGLLPLGDASLRNLRWFILLGVVLVALVYIDIQFIIWRSETYTLTDQRVILKRGVIGKFSRSISLSRVQDVTTSQRLFGRLLNYGTVEVESAGHDGAEVLTCIPDPGHFRNVLFERLHPDLGPGSSTPAL
ncbi:MAG: PH domain-containing protein [Candidatus Dormibacteria bacterium]